MKGQVKFSPSFCLSTQVFQLSKMGYTKLNNKEMEELEKVFQ